MIPTKDVATLFWYEKQKKLSCIIIRPPFNSFPKHGGPCLQIKAILDIATSSWWTWNLCQQSVTVLESHSNSITNSEDGGRGEEGGKVSTKRWEVHNKSTCYWSLLPDITFSITEVRKKTNLTLLHSERPKLHRVLAVLSAKWLTTNNSVFFFSQWKQAADFFLVCRLCTKTFVYM